MERRFADWLGRKLAGTPRGLLQVYVVLFFVVVFGLAQLITDRFGPPLVMRLPLHLDGKERMTYSRQDFEHLIDSLRRDPVTGRQFDSLVRADPRLMWELNRMGMFLP